MPSEGDRDAATRLPDEQAQGSDRKPPGTSAGGQVLSRMGSNASRRTVARTGSVSRTCSGNDFDDDEMSGLQGGGGARGAGGGRVARQLFYSELLARPGGPWAWFEAGNSREKALPKNFYLSVFERLDIVGVSLLERSARLWHDLLQTIDGQGVWQRVVHERVGKVLIESYKLAMGLRAGQSYEQEKVDLQSRNWRRIMRMHRANLKLPYLDNGFLVTLLSHHQGPVLCMCTGGPYLFTGGSDGKLLMYRMPLFLTYTKDRVRDFKTPPAPSRVFGQPKEKNGDNIANDCPILSIVAQKDFVITGGVDGVIKLWKMESAPGSACARKYVGHKGSVWCMDTGTMTHDGEDIQILISGSADKTIAIWNILGPKDAKPLLRLEGHFGGITSVAFIPDCNQIVSGSEDTTMRLWSLKSGYCQTVLEGHKQAVTALVPWNSTTQDTAVPGGVVRRDMIFSASREGLIRMWDRDAAVQISEVRGDGPRCACVCVCVCVSVSE